MTAIVNDTAEIARQMKILGIDGSRDKSADVPTPAPVASTAVPVAPALPSYGPGGDPNNADEYAGDGGYMG